MPSIGLPVLMTYYLECKVTQPKSTNQFYFNNELIPKLSCQDTKLY
jgi:hypothetical protein